MSRRLRRAGPSGQGGAAHQVPVAFAGRAATFVDGPYDQTLATTAISGCENARHAGGERAVLDELQRAKPASAKGRYLKKIVVSSTMGPGVKVDANRLRPEVAA